MGYGACHHWVVEFPFLYLRISGFSQSACLWERIMWLCPSSLLWLLAAIRSQLAVNPGHQFLALWASPWGSSQHGSGFPESERETERASKMEDIPSIPSSQKPHPITSAVHY